MIAAGTTTRPTSRRPTDPEGRAVPRVGYQSDGPWSPQPPCFGGIDTLDRIMCSPPRIAPPRLESGGPRGQPRGRAQPPRESPRPPPPAPPPPPPRPRPRRRPPRGRPPPPRGGHR